MDKRRIVQIASAVFTNGYLKGFLKGKIYTGNLKKNCVPGLNCYSCPGALGSCPIGSMQAVIGSMMHKFSFYILGFIATIGILFGRLICGWICPFGLIQDILNKIPSPKIRVVKGDKFLKYLKYVILIMFVILLPMVLADELGMSDPYFCKYICPVGTLEGGIPLVVMNEPLKSTIGFLYAWKITLLVITIILSIILYRPFCRYVCPLGALYSIFNPISFYKFKIDKDKCSECGLCTKKCKMNIKVYREPNSPECIRCGQCKSACPQNAIKSGILK